MASTALASPSPVRAAPAVRPRDAAGIVVLREGRRGPEVLLGRRSRRARFMPGVYVFPGGTLDPQDRRPSGFEESLPPAWGPIDRATRQKLTALARCALREVWEETGLLLGQPGTPRQEPGGTPWQRFADAGVAPAFGGLRLAVRAITPAYSPIRFHTRFFLLSDLEPLAAGSGDGELEDIGFVPTAEVLDLPMSSVTALVLAECMAQRRDPQRPSRLFAWSADDRPRYR